MSADADPHYQKLYGRVTDVCSNRRGQPNLSAMKEPHPGRNPSLIRFASPSGKYAFSSQNLQVRYLIFYITCGYRSDIGPQVPWAIMKLLPYPRSSKLSLLGLMAKIKCSICSYQFNIWYAGHSPAHILIWFLAFGQGSEACLTLTTGCLGIALQPSAAHYLTNENHEAFNHSYCDIGRYGDIPIFRSSENSDMILTWNLKGLKLIRNYICF